MARHDPGAIRITSATRSHSDDIAGRQRRYVVSMALRTACFLLAVAFAGTFMMWVFLLGAFVLPSVAVVLANARASTEPGPDPDTAYAPVRPTLGPPRRS